MIPAIDKLAAAVSSGADPRPLIGELYTLARRVDVDGKRQLLHGLERVLRSGSPERLADVATLAGAIVEIGGDPRDFPGAVFDHLAAMLAAIPEPASGEDIELPQHYYLVERAAMACLSRSSELRQRLPQRPLLETHIRRLGEGYGFLGKMLAIIDDEPLLVLHPASRCGYRFRMRGIADNFQLHVLLLGALAGKGKDRIDGIVPTAAALAAAGGGDNVERLTVESTWQLANWFALRPGGTVVGMRDTKEWMRAWIWNEGVPADIAPFDGVRVVLVGPSTIRRSWTAQRVFPDMPGRLVREADLPEAEAKRVLAAIAERVGREPTPGAG